ncbi:hypothetical protein [Arsukibacterium perlucidum]|uniref:hypothetical protein n=1 Tax=Arsukibacterium perlucidum TaxID=368811 RepID=UPI0004783911|nr:hypothetical protein [Arsukibacterium perlucidum]
MTMLCRKPFSMALFIRALIPYLIIGFTLNVPLLHAAPGAHGPDGEHLTTETSQPLSLLPRFEAFSDVFELVGELQPDALVLHLHDYQSNRPLANAQIELETANLSSTANFIADKNHYVIDDPALLAGLQQPGLHEIILTIISSDNADLLTASLDFSAVTNDDHGSEDHHHGHFPWWSLLLPGLLLFGAGMLVGRRGAGK